MSIDWFTFVAQAVNLLVLILLLRHFLYRPVMRAMERREQSIASSLEEAEQRREEAREQARRNRARGEELERRREQLLVEVRQEVDRRREELMQSAREQVERSRREWTEALQREREGWLAGVRREAAEQVFAAVEQALRELADRSCELSVVDVFLRRLEQAGDERRQQLSAALEHGELQVRSAFPLSEEQRPRLRQALEALVGGAPRISFDTDDSLVCGIEVGADGRAVGWSVGQYLGDLERELESSLAGRSAGAAAGEQA